MPDLKNQPAITNPIICVHPKNRTLIGETLPENCLNRNDIRVYLWLESLGSAGILAAIEKCACD